MGNLYLEPESGPVWDPKRVCLPHSWKYIGPAQDDVLVPEDRNIQLIVQLAVRQKEAAKLRAQNPLLYL